MKKASLLLSVFICFIGPIYGQAGSIDPTFNPADLGFGIGDGANASVRTTAIQSDGKTFIGGRFNSYNAFACSYIARVNVNGTYDTTFIQGTGFNNNVNSISIQNDGKIIVGGLFDSFNGILRSKIARLNADGSLDTSFNPGNGANLQVWTTSIQSDGKIIIGGDFTSFNGITRNKIARLNANGTLDTTFNPGSGANNAVRSSNIQSDGKIIIGGGFFLFNGASRNNITRLNSDGSLDGTFNIGSGGNGFVHSISIQSDGKIIIGGNFTAYDGTTRNRIARINVDGSLDNTFNAGIGATNQVTTTNIQSDGKIIIGGYFTAYDGTTRNRIARLNSDGSLDIFFNPGIGADKIIYATSIQSDGKIIIGGDFNSFDGTPRNFLTRLNTDASHDSTFNPGTGAIDQVRATAIQSDGKIIIGGSFTSFNETVKFRLARLNNDGTLDNTFNSGIGAIGFVTNISIQSDGKIIIVGTFNSYYGIPRNCIARLNVDGSLDITFDPGSGVTGIINTTSIQIDGKIIIGGYFSSYNGTPRSCIARLNTDGSLDSNFNPGSGANDPIVSTSIQSDGKIIIGGWFTNYAGIPRGRIARVNADGTLDTSFDSFTGTNNYVLTTSIQSDGKIIFAGAFSSFNGIQKRSIARLNPDGSLDVNFDPGLGTQGHISTTSIQNDGKIIIGGLFSAYNGFTYNNLARLNADGSRDITFVVGSGADKIVQTTTIQSNGDIIIGGDFVSYNGVGKNRVARIKGDGNPASTNPSLSEFKHGKMLAYPNPMRDELVFEIPGNNMIRNFEIINGIGQIIYKGDLIEKTFVHTANFKPGLYLVKLENGSFFDYMKIIKE